jgi:heme-degrading monooxygenase HmoA
MSDTKKVFSKSGERILGSDGAASRLVERSELTVKPGAEDEFHTVIVNKGIPLLQGVAGVVSVQLGKGVENPSKFMLLVEWETLEAHTMYQGTQAAADLRAMMGPFVAGGAMEHFHVQ